MNKIPEIGDRLEVLGHTIEVVDIDAHRIDKVLITRPARELGEEDQ